MYITALLPVQFLICINMKERHAHCIAKLWESARETRHSCESRGCTKPLFTFFFLQGRFPHLCQMIWLSSFLLLHNAWISFSVGSAFCRDCQGVISTAGWIFCLPQTILLAGSVLFSSSAFCLLIFVFYSAFSYRPQF